MSSWAVYFTPSHWEPEVRLTSLFKKKTTTTKKTNQIDMAFRPQSAKWLNYKWRHQKIPVVKMNQNHVMQAVESVLNDSLRMSFQKLSKAPFWPSSLASIYTRMSLRPSEGNTVLVPPAPNQPPRIHLSARHVVSHNAESLHLLHAHWLLPHACT